MNKNLNLNPSISLSIRPILITILTALFSIVHAATIVYNPVMVGEAFRHGARTPCFNIFKEDWAVQQGIGNLTANGMRMHQLLGQ
jgi:hypothetical protein